MQLENSEEDASYFQNEHKEYIKNREELNVGTVPMFKMHNVGTVPTFKMHNVGTAPTSKMYNIGTVPTFKMHNVGTQVFYDSFSKFGLDGKINDCSLHSFFYLSRLSLSSCFLSSSSIRWSALIKSSFCNKLCRAPKFVI